MDKKIKTKLEKIGGTLIGLFILFFGITSMSIMISLIGLVITAMVLKGEVSGDE